jgi:hypothetical protein
MLEQVKTKKNQPALKWQGRWLSSSVDAASEATKWMGQQALNAEDAFPIVVLGVGSGYHLVALVKDFPGRQVIAVDISQPIIDSTRAQHGLVLANVKFVCAKNTNDLYSSLVLQHAVSGPYSLLLYSPATVPDPALYTEMQMYLVGRSEAGLQFLFHVREHLAHDLSANTIHTAAQEAISIKTLVGRIAKKCSPDTKLIFLALRELVD